MEIGICIYQVVVFCVWIWLLLCTKAIYHRISLNCKYTVIHTFVYARIFWNNQKFTDSAGSHYAKINPLPHQISNFFSVSSLLNIDDTVRVLRTSEGLPLSALPCISNSQPLPSLKKPFFS